MKLVVPDRDSVLRDVVLGYDEPAGYEKNGCFFSGRPSDEAETASKARVLCWKEEKSTFRQ